MNMKSILTIKKAWETFTNNHPKFPLFLDAVKRTGIKEGTIIAIQITDEEGRVIETNLKITQSDLELVDVIKSIRE